MSRLRVYFLFLFNDDWKLLLLLLFLRRFTLSNISFLNWDNSLFFRYWLLAYWFSLWYYLMYHLFLLSWFLYHINFNWFFLWCSFNYRSFDFCNWCFNWFYLSCRSLWTLGLLFRYWCLSSWFLRRWLCSHRWLFLSWWVFYIFNYGFCHRFLLLWFIFTFCWLFANNLLLLFWFWPWFLLFLNNNLLSSATLLCWDDFLGALFSCIGFFGSLTMWWLYLLLVYFLLLLFLNIFDQILIDFIYLVAFFLFFHFIWLVLNWSDDLLLGRLTMSFLIGRIFLNRVDFRWRLGIGSGNFSGRF